MAVADGAMNNVLEKSSSFLQSFSEFVACCRTKRESLHDQSLTCRQARSSQHLQRCIQMDIITQRQTDRQAGRHILTDTYTHKETKTQIMLH